MSIEDNKVLVRRFIDEVMNAGNIAAIADFCVPGSLFAGGIEGQTKTIKKANPDACWTIDEMLAEDNKVVARITIRGTNTGPIIGLPPFGRLEVPLPPTGNSVTVTSITIFKITEGKIVSYSSEFDQLALLLQLGCTITPPVQT